MGEPAVSGVECKWEGKGWEFNAEWSWLSAMVDVKICHLIEVLIDWLIEKFYKLSSALTGI